MYNKPDQRSGKTHRHLFNGSPLRVSWVHRSYTPHKRYVCQCSQTSVSSYSTQNNCFSKQQQDIT